MTVVNGSAVFVAEVGVDWSEVQAGYIFLVGENDVWFEVVSVAFVSGKYQITADAPWAGVSGDSSYVIVLSYSPNFRIPYAESGDVKTNLITKRAILVIDGLVNSGGVVSPSTIQFKTQGGKTFKTQGGKNIVKQN